MPRVHSHYEDATCHYFSAGTCRSCPLLDVATGSRLTTKLARLTSTLRQYNVHPQRVRDAITVDAPWHTRHKVKMSISGSVTDPTVGITREDRSAHDLIECSLSAEPIRELLRYLPKLITAHSLLPYDIEKRTGELKYIIITSTKRGDRGIVRFILRSHTALSNVRAAAQELTARFPWIDVVSCNIQPIPAAILEGPEEVPITQATVIKEEFDSLPLYFTPQSFMQVTPSIAQQLYAYASHTVSAIAPTYLLDLFCGVGGFSLSAAPHCREVLGIEISPHAITCAQRSAQELGLTNVRFQATNVEKFVRADTGALPDMIVLNPPRRGISEEMSHYLKRTAPRHILYSSCNPDTFARDVLALSSHYTVSELTPFDMFPMTYHWEVLGLLTANSPG